jgi:hypothetical protein
METYWNKRGNWDIKSKFEIYKIEVVILGKFNLIKWDLIKFEWEGRIDVNDLLS